jgi:hypothetical protein
MYVWYIYVLHNMDSSVIIVSHIQDSGGGDTMDLTPLWICRRHYACVRIPAFILIMINTKIVPSIRIGKYSTWFGNEWIPCILIR